LSPRPRFCPHVEGASAARNFHFMRLSKLQLLLLLANIHSTTENLMHFLLRQVLGCRWRGQSTTESEFQL